MPPFPVREVLKILSVIDAPNMEIVKNELSGEYEFKSNSSEVILDTYIRCLESTLIKEVSISKNLR